jgi:hypothetical protein
MKKYYNYETENPIIKDELRKYLKENNIYYELSSCFDGWHFEIKLSEEEAEKATWFLDSLFDVYEF